MKTATQNVVDHEVRRRVGTCLTTAITVMAVILSHFGMAFGQAVTVQTSPAGLSFTVDGATYTSAQTFDWAPVSNHVIATASQQTGGGGSEYVCMGWSDGGELSHDITVPDSPISYSATFAVNQGNSQGFIPTGSMTLSSSLKDNPTATLLRDGRVLIIGGGSGDGAELYDPATGAFTSTGTQYVYFFHHTATLLSNGSVLITGLSYENSGSASNNAVVYNPVTGVFMPTGSMTTSREYQTATLLPNGKVLIAGGLFQSFPLNSAELYDPVTGTFTPTGSMTSFSIYQTATLLQNGTVLIVNSFGEPDLYDPATGAFTPITNLNGLASEMATNSLHSATLLPNGSVLIAGINNVNIGSNAVVYNPATYTFTPAGSMTTYRSGHTATLLPNGKVLIAGGVDKTFTSLSSAELYDTTSGTFTPRGSMTAPRYGHTATLLPTGSVLAAGGFSGGNSSLNSAELYGTQADITTITVQTSPAGRSFTVDGATYTSAQTFDWIPGSSHDIATVSPQNGAAGTRYFFADWSDGGSLSHTITVPTTAATYTATFATQYQLTISAGTGGGVTPANDSWYDAGATANLQAVADSGYTFASWTGPVADPNSANTTVTMSGPR